jgi:hypothetical protein
LANFPVAETRELMTIRAFLVLNPRNDEEIPLDQRLGRYTAFREKGGVRTSDVKPIAWKVDVSHFFIGSAVQF